MHSKKNTNRKGRFTLNRFRWFSLVLTGALLACTNCAGLSDLFTPDPQTGITVTQAGNELQLRAVSKASDNAIEKDSTAMMQTTSREAGRLMVISELSGRVEDGYEPAKLKITSVEFIKRGKFAVTTATYPAD